jgi:adenosylcobinamide kinase/adenosylcobinamide-phosphate guanylyltransferase
MDIGCSLQTTAAGVIIVDCITLLVNNILLSLPENTSEDIVMEKVRAEMDELIAAQARLGGQWLVVSNEVGLGLVPPYPLGRLYRDALGRANQALAQKAARVILMVAGIPMVIK